MSRLPSIDVVQIDKQPILRVTDFFLRFIHDDFTFLLRPSQNAREKCSSIRIDSVAELQLLYETLDCDGCLS